MLTKFNYCIYIIEVVDCTSTVAHSTNFLGAPLSHLLGELPWCSSVPHPEGTALAHLSLTSWVNCLGAPPGRTALVHISPTSWGWGGTTLVRTSPLHPGGTALVHISLTSWGELPWCTSLLPPGGTALVPLSATPWENCFGANLSHLLKDLPWCTSLPPLSHLLGELSWCTPLPPRRRAALKDLIMRKTFSRLFQSLQLFPFHVNHLSSVKQNTISISPMNTLHYSKTSVTRLFS